MTAVQVSLVFEECDELSPRRVLLVPGVVRLFEHLLDIQVLDEYGVVRLHEPRRKLVLVVQYLPLDVTPSLRHFPALCLPVTRSFLFSGEFPLLAAEPIILVFEIDPIHGLPVTRVDVVENTEVDPHAVTRGERFNSGFLRDVFVFSFETERDEPLTRGFLFEGGFFDRGVVRNRARVPDSHPPNFAEPNVCVLVVAPLFIEVKARLIVRDASVVAGCLPFEPTDSVPLFFEFTQDSEIVVEASDGGLCSFRVCFCEHWPLAFPLGEFVVLVVLARFVVLGTVRVVPADVVVELAMNV